MTYITYPYEIDFIANHLFGQIGTVQTAYWIALFTVAPNTDGTVYTEVSNASTGYARVMLPNNKTVLTTSDNGDGQVSNVDEIQFLPATASWGTVVGVGIMDSNSTTTANLLFYASLPVPKAFDDGDIAFFAPGDIMWTVQNITD